VEREAGEKEERDDVRVTCESNDCGWLHESQTLEGGEKNFRKVYRISGGGEKNLILFQIPVLILLLQFLISTLVL
jgi:hypothetical protein